MCPKVVSAPVPASLRTQVCDPGVYEFPEAPDALVPVLVVPGLGLRCTYLTGGTGEMLRSLVTDHTGNNPVLRGKIL